MICPGDLMWLHGKPVTVFIVHSHHIYYFPGHHSWTTCRIDDLREMSDAQ